MISATGKTLSAARLFLVAKKACERLNTIPSSTTGGQDDSLIAIVFSAASIEAFFNELPELLSEFPDPQGSTEAEKIGSYVGLADEVEANKGSVKLKYLLAYSVLSGQQCNKGGNPYQDFSLLVDARNRLMHAKPGGSSGELFREGTDVSAAASDLPEKFRTKGILDTSQPGLVASIEDETGVRPIGTIPFPMSFDFRIATKAAAVWACNTAADIIGSILNVLPDVTQKENRGGSGNSDSVVSGRLASPPPPRGGRREERGNETNETESRSDL